MFVWLWLVVNDRKFPAGTIFFSHKPASSTSSRTSNETNQPTCWSLKKDRLVRRTVSTFPRHALVGSCVESHCITVLSVLLSYINARLTPVCISTYVKVWLAPENSTSSPLYCPEQSEENSSAIRQLSCSMCSSHFHSRALFILDRIAT